MSSMGLAADLELTRSRERHQFSSDAMLSSRKARFSAAM
jgi:hypothetical protein